MQWWLSSHCPRGWTGDRCLSVRGQCKFIDDLTGVVVSRRQLILAQRALTRAAANQSVTAVNLTTAMDIQVGVDDSLDGHLSKLQNLVGCLQSLEDALLADEVKEGGSDSPGKKGGSWSGNTDPATPKQPVRVSDMFPCVDRSEHRVFRRLYFE